MKSDIAEQAKQISNLTAWLAVRIEPDILNSHLLAMSPEERSSLLDRVGNIRKVVSDLYDGIKNFALASGEEFRGYEIKSGTGKRVWSGNDAEVAEKLSTAFNVDPRAFLVLKSPAQVEKDRGGSLEAKNIVAKLTDVQPGALSLYAKKEQK